MVGILNVITRCVVFIWKFVLAFVSCFWVEFKDSIGHLARYGLRAVSRVALPLLGVYLAATASLQLAELMKVYVFRPSLGGSTTVVWSGIKLTAAVFVAVICFARTSPSRFLETFFRDLAVIVAYGIPTLLLSMVALVLGNKSSVPYLGIDLRFRLGPLSWTCALLLALGTLYLWRNRLVAAARNARFGSSPKTNAP